MKTPKKDQQTNTFQIPQLLLPSPLCIVAASVMLSSHNTLVRTESNAVLSFTCLHPAICGFSFDVTVTGMTLSWTNIQLKRRKNLNWFYTDNPGVFCCNVIHRSQAEPLSRGDISVLAPTIHIFCGYQKTLAKLYQQIHFLQLFLKCWAWLVSPTAYSAFLGGL